MIKYIVTDKGPIDRHAPGADVTGFYRGDKLQRLIDEGYIAEDKPRQRRSTAEVATKSHIDAVTDDGQPADEDGE